MRRMLFEKMTKLFLLALLLAIGGQVSWAQDLITGSIGLSARYEFNPQSGVFRVYGTGAVEHKFGSNPTLIEIADDVTSLIVEEGITKLEQQAFQGLSNLKSAKLPNSLTEMDECTFLNCQKLESVNIPNGITELKSTFYGCRSLAHVDLPEGLTKIGTVTFAYCDALKNVTLPSTINQIEANPFYNCNVPQINVYPSFADAEVDDMFYSTLSTTGGKVCVMGGTASSYNNLNGRLPANWTWENTAIYTGSAGSNSTYTLNMANGELRISGTGVLSTSFYSQSEVSTHRDAVKRIVVEEGITGLAANAFASLPNLVSVSLPITVDNISTGAFHDDTSLREIALPDTLTAIGASTFAGCTSLEKVVLPASLLSIGNQAFNNCSKLTTIEANLRGWAQLSLGSNVFDNVAEQGLVIEKKGEMSDFTTMCSALPEGWKRLILSDSNKDGSIYYLNPDTKTLYVNQCKYGLYRWWGENSKLYDATQFVENVVVKEGITELVTKQFLNYTAMKHVSLPSTLTDIANETFDNCTSLTEIIIPDAVTSIYGTAFRGCTSLVTAILPETMSYIGGSLFRGCTALKNVKLPKTVTKELYTGSLFLDCKALKTVELPTGKYVLGDYCFEGCDSLETLVVPEGVTYLGFRTLQGCKSLQSISLPSTLTSINNQCFEGCASLQSIVIPEGVTTIGSEAFSACSNLQHVSLPQSLTTIKFKAFNGCSSLEEITIPQNVVIEGTVLNLFAGCTKLKSATILANWTTIPDGMFSGCSELETVTIPQTVTEIADCAFRDCKKLNNVQLPIALTKLKAYAFQGCSQLETLVFPSGFTELENLSLYNCKNLKKITFTSSVAPSVLTNALQNLPTTGTLYLPYGYGNDYTELKNTYFAGWDVMNVGKAGENIYYYYENVTLKLYGQGTLDDISDYFEEEDRNKYYDIKANCYEIEVGEGITSIGTGAFRYWKNVEKLTLPSTLTSILNNAFQGCSGLGNINLHEGLTTIENYAFAGCDSLRAIDIPSTVTKIGNYAFMKCSNLKDVGFTRSTAPTTLGTGIFNEVAENGVLTIGSASQSSYQAVIDQVPSSWQLANGKCGESAYYNVTSLTGGRFQLNVFGTGKIESSPWSNDLRNFYVMRIGEGITGMATNVVDKEHTLEVVYFPASLTSLDERALGWNSNLTALRFAGTTPPSMSNIAMSVNTGLIDSEFFCPESAVAAYAASNLKKSLGRKWSLCVDEELSDGTSYKVNTDTKTLTVKGKGAMRNYNLSSIAPWRSSSLNNYINKVVVSGFTSVGNNAFLYMTNVEEVELPASVTSIGANAFDGCKLKSVTLPKNLETVGVYAFSNNSTLTSVTFPANIKTISGAAFRGDNNLTHIKFEGTTMPTINYSPDDYAYDPTFNDIAPRGLVTLPAKYASNYEGLWENLPSLWEVSDGTVGKDMAYKLRYGILHLYGSGKTSEVSSTFGGADRSTIDVVTLGNGVSLDNAGTFFNGMKTDGAIIASEDMVSTINADATLPSTWTAYNVTASGTKANVTWTFSHGVLSFTGSGEDLYLYEGDTPGWNNYINAVEKVKFPNSKVSTISGFVFTGHKALRELTLPNTLANLVARDMKDVKIEELTLPSSIKVLHGSALQNITTLKRLNLNCLTAEFRIPQGFLLGCDNLTEININASNKQDAFDFMTSYLWCNMLYTSSTSKTLLINDKPTSLVKLTDKTSDHMFQNLSNVKYVVLDGENMEISIATFRNSSVKHVTVYKSSPSDFNVKHVLGWNNGITLHVPAGCAEAYHSDDSWKGFTVMDNAIEGVTLAGESTVHYTKMPSSRYDMIEVVDYDNNDIKCVIQTEQPYAEIFPFNNYNYLHWYDQRNVWDGSDNLDIEVRVQWLFGGAYKNTTMHFIIDQTEDVMLTENTTYTLTEDMTLDGEVGYRTPAIERNKLCKWIPLFLPIECENASVSPNTKIAEVFAISPINDTNNDGKIDMDDELVMIIEKLYTVSEKLCANTPYLYRPLEESSGYEFTSYDNTLYAATDEPYDISTSRNTYLINGLYKNTTVEADNNNFVVDPSTGKFVYCDEPTDLKTFQWYIHASSKNYGGEQVLERMKASPMRIVAIGDEIDKETAIKLVAEGKAIQVNNGMYTLDGKRVTDETNLPAGIYIKHGKRVVVK